MDDNKTVHDLIVDMNREIQLGFLHLHTYINDINDKLFKLTCTTYGLLDLLIEKGVITPEELKDKIAGAQARLKNQDRWKEVRFVVQPDHIDGKAGDPLPEINCEENLPLCKAACCSMDFLLTLENLKENRLLWDLGRPYAIRRFSDGYCGHWLRDGMHCSIYEGRPMVCRRYTCVKDERIWTDYEKRIPNTKFIDTLLQRKVEIILRESDAIQPLDPLTSDE
jgi:Fe-S-cluster containining protein